MNKYYLENSFGESINLMDFENFVSRGFNGFGYDIDIDYIQIADNFIKDNESVKQRKIKFTTEILRNQHENYNRLTNFIIRNKNDLKLVCIKENEKIYIDVDLESCDKKEKTTYIVDFEFGCKSLWYKKINKKYTLRASENENRFSVKFPFKITDEVEEIINVMNNGHIYSPFILDIYGFAQNPKVTIISEFGKEEVITFNVTLEKGDKITLCTKDDDLYVEITRSDGRKENGYNTLDFNKRNFIKLSTGKNIIKIEKNIQEANVIIFEGYLTI